MRYGHERVERGAGGETHQLPDGGPSLTTQQGVVVADDENTLRIGQRGPTLLEDFHIPVNAPKCPVHNFQQDGHAPKVGGVTAADGNRIEADQRLDGAPSVLYDAVVILTNTEGASMLAELPPARDFVNDAFAHCKFIGYDDAATALFDSVGLAGKLDGGFLALEDEASVGTLLDTCTQLRFWDRDLAFVS